jgi:hypothetical protein
MKLRIFSVAIALFALGTVSNARADAAWSSVGAGCIADSPFASKIFTGSHDGSVRFASGQTGYIQMTCPVHQELFTDCSPTRVGVTASDPDDAGSRAYVSVWFNANSISGPNAVSNLAWVYSDSVTKKTTWSSNGFSLSALYFGHNYYWVSVEMYRASTAQNPVFYGAQVGCETFL